MNELLLKRVTRRLENLPDDQGYRVLDYIEFLESKYATGERKATPLERITDAVEDTMRVGRIPGVAIRGTMRAMDSATNLMDKLADAGRAAVDELGKTLADQGGEQVTDVEGEETEQGEEPPATA